MSGRKNVVSRGRFFVSGLCFLLMRLSLVTALGFVGWIIVSEETPQYAFFGVGASFGILLICGIQVISNARRVTCPLCRASLFMSSRNLVKPGVAKACGCAKTPLAFSVLTYPKVLSCPYCAEKVRLVRS